MKKVILAFVFTFFAGSVVFAQSEPVQSDQETSVVIVKEEGTKTKIEKEELPEKVKTAIETAYAEAEIKEVYKVESTEGAETTYEVHVDKAGEKVKLQYKASGEAVEKEG